MDAGPPFKPSPGLLVCLSVKVIVVLILSSGSCCLWLAESPPRVLGLPGWSLDFVHPWPCLGMSVDPFLAHVFVCPAKPLWHHPVVGEDTALPGSPSAPSPFPPAPAAPWKNKYILVFFSTSCFPLSTGRSLQHELEEARLF